MVKKGTASPLEGTGSSAVIAILGSTYTSMTPALCHKLTNGLEPSKPAPEIAPKIAAPQAPSFMQAPTPPTPGKN